VKKVVRTFLIVLGGLVGIVGIGILAANLYIQSKPTQSKIERKLSETLHMPLEIQRTSLTPWGGLSITGITVPQSQPDNPNNFLEAQECSIHFQLLPLFQRKLVIDRVLIDAPKVAWVQNANGRWVFPEAAPAAASEPAPVPPTPGETPSPEPQPSPAPEASASPAPELPVESVKPFEVIMSRLKIRNGSFDFLDAKGRRVAMFTNVNVKVPSATPDLFNGTATCEKISFRDRMFAGELKTHFSYSRERLALSGLKVGIAEGSVTGDAVIKTSEPKSPFSADVKFEKVDINRLISEAGGPWNQAGGALSGYLDIYGQTGNAASINGSGQLVLSNGQLNQYEIFQMLGKILQIEELLQLNLEQASASWRIENGVILVDQLILKSANLRLTAHGTVQPDGRLDLDANLAINKKISRQLPDFIEENFIPVENSDLRSLDFKIYGTASRPRTDLESRVLGKDIEKKIGKKAVDFLNNFIGGKKQKKKITFCRKR